MTSQEPVFEFPLTLGGPGRMRALHTQLRAAILERRLLPGAPLPSTRRVAASYGIARNTVISAYDRLVAEGYVVTRAGAKAAVADVARLPAARRSARARSDQLNPYWRRASHWRTPYPVGTADFRLGTPEHRYFPHAVWRRLLLRVLNPQRGAPRDYHGPQGLPRLCAAIAQHVSFARAVACSADDVIVTSGAQQAFDLLARVLVTPQRTRVAVEDPGYPLLRLAMAAAGAQLLPVAVDEQGLCVERLPQDARVVCVTPSHQFPTGVAMSMARRAALLAFARSRGAAIIEDDYDGEFRYGIRPLDALQTLDRDASVFYVGTFSKSLFPTLRVGYLVAPAWAREALLAAKQCADNSGNAQLQDALAHFIVEGHLARYVRRMRRIYAQRRQALLESLGRELQPWLAPLPAEAGIHVAARYRDPRAAARIEAQLRLHAPGALPLRRFASRTDFTPGVAFGFGSIEAEAIGAALRRLAGALARR